jgi:hypothetical protein
MQFEIEVLSVGEPQTTKTARGGYQSIEVAYKKDGKIEGKKIMSFVNPAVFKAVSTLKQGDLVTITAEKGEPNAAGQAFWQWVNISAGGEPSAGVSNSSPSVPSQASTKPVSNYETREERTAKQHYIVRQSSITAALALLGTKAKSVSDVTKVASEFEAFVFGEAEKILQDDLQEVYEDVPL